MEKHLLNTKSKYSKKTEIFHISTMNIEQLKVSVKHFNYNIKRNTYNLCIHKEFHIEVGKITYDSHNKEIIFQNVIILDKMKPDELMQKVESSIEEIILDYLLM